MCSGRASDRHHAVDAERTEAVCALLSAGANPAAVCDGQTFATAGSNPRPADPRAGRSATHTSGPRLGQAVALRGDARRRRDRRDAARRRRCAGDVRDAGRGRSAAVGTRRGGGLRDAGQAPDALELKGDVNTKVRSLRKTWRGVSSPEDLQAASRPHALPFASRLPSASPLCLLLSPLDPA